MLFCTSPPSLSIRSDNHISAVPFLVWRGALPYLASYYPHYLKRSSFVRFVNLPEIYFKRILGQLFFKFSHALWSSLDEASIYSCFCLPLLILWCSSLFKPLYSFFPRVKAFHNYKPFSCFYFPDYDFYVLQQIEVPFMRSFSLDR